MPPAPKLTDTQARDIYRRRTEETPPPSWRDLAAEFGVAHSAIKAAFDRVAESLAKATTPAEALLSPTVIATAPHNRIAPSTLNPRKRFDPIELENLVESVRVEGVLLPLLIRRANQPGNTPVDGDADYEIIAGERRWRAVGVLINTADLTADVSVPIRLIDPCDDVKAIEIALTENVARKDMTPWEEAEAFDRLKQLGRSAAEIAGTVGMNKRTVEMRLRLVRALGPAAKDALRDGLITVEAANVLAAFCSPVSQPLAVEKIAAGQFPTTRDLKRFLTQALIPTSFALFSVEDYTGELIEDEADPDRVYFADAKAFERLQQKAIAELELKARGEGYAWTKVLDNRKSEWFATGEYAIDETEPERGVVFEIRANGQVIDHRDVVALAERRRAEERAKTAAYASAAGMGDGSQAFTKAHFSHARRRKTVALQSALGRSPMIALRAACLALIGCADNVRIRTEHRGAEDKVDSPEVVATIERYLPRFAHVCKEGFEVTGGDVQRKNLYPSDEGAAWEVLAAMPDAEVGEFFAALMALRVGSFGTYNPEAGDRPAVVGMARSLGLIGAEAAYGLTLAADDLAGLRKPALLDVWAQVAPLKPATDRSLDGWREDILCQAPADYVLPTLRFADKASVEAMLKEKPADARQIDLEEAIAAKEACDLRARVRAIVESTLGVEPGSMSEGDSISSLALSPPKLHVLVAELAAELDLPITYSDMAPMGHHSILAHLANIVERVARDHGQKAEANSIAKASAPTGALEICLMSLRRVLSAHSVFAAKAEGDTPFAEIIGEEDFDRVADDLAKAFGVPSITADVLHTIEDLDHLALAIENHRAALDAEGRAA